jgi:hypothetical protein
MLPKPRCIGNQLRRRNPCLGPQPNQQLNLRLGPHLGSQRNPRHSLRRNPRRNPQPNPQSSPRLNPRRNHSPGRINSGLKPIPARCNVHGVRW